MAESTSEGEPAGAAQHPAAGADEERLAQQIAERVYRLMMAEARLARARGQQPLRREER